VQSRVILQARDVGLTPIQLKVLEFVLAGLSNQEIATECNLASWYGKKYSFNDHVGFEC